MEDLDRRWLSFFCLHVMEISSDDVVYAMAMGGGGGAGGGGVGLVSESGGLCRCWSESGLEGRAGGYSAVRTAVKEGNCNGGQGMMGCKESEDKICRERCMEEEACGELAEEEGREGRVMIMTVGKVKEG
ncbi:hypothetical protein Pcinc_008389 [Petrolisthes cinctipes]|uniref:Uncharacterized protein n=1 Tax=Petrolisthes cinctipes TaxID=88211 RepID=A0AAE1G934_PETCI|nr:hypothetical protein Pcinc_008389 [Petrolisthes cinctipes]